MSADRGDRVLNLPPVGGRIALYTALRRSTYSRLSYAGRTLILR
jgi:hypothetical protein